MAKETTPDVSDATVTKEERAKRNPGITEIVEMKGRGHSLTAGRGWHEVADTALAFVKRFV